MHTGGFDNDLARLINFMPSSVGSRKSVRRISKCSRSSNSIADGTSSATYTSYRSSNAVRRASRMVFSSSTIRRVGLIMEPGLQQPGLALAQREPDAKGGSFPHTAVQFNASTVRSDDALNNHETQ